MRGGRADGGTGFDEAELHFSLAHAEDHAAIAVTRGRPLGVDIERIRPIEDAQQIAARYFAPEEAAELASLEESERGAAFFACWTRKEAYLKATGAGLSSSMAGFGVSLRPDAPPRLLHIAGDEAAAAAWTLHAMRLIPGFAAALAYPGAPRRLCLCGEPG
jgi:4'-phosphopantetheinyl transferase